MSFVVERIASSEGEASALLQEARTKLLTQENLPTSRDWTVDREHHRVLVAEGGSRGGEGEPESRRWYALDRDGLYWLVTEELAERKDGAGGIRRKLSLGQCGLAKPGYSPPGPDTLRWVAEALRVYEAHLLSRYYAQIEVAVVDARTGGTV